MAIAFNPGSTVPSLGLRRASGSSLSAHGRQRSVLTLGSKRAATVGLRASVESATETAKQKKAVSMCGRSCVACGRASGV